MKYLLLLVPSLLFLSITNLSAQIGSCAAVLDMTHTETDLGNGNCEYTFDVEYGSGANNTSLELTISCGSSTLVPATCSGSLSSTGGILSYGPIIAPCCTGPFQIDWTGTTNPNCGGNECDAGTLLPVELSSWTLSKRNNKIVFEWSTASEINNDYFEIEHSTDMRNFQSIKQITGMGNSSTKIDYSVEAINSFALGIQYFRLKQVDFDGRKTYSELITIENQFETFQVFPNPASHNISINTAMNEPVELFDLDGRLIRTFRNQDLERLDISFLEPGMYLLVQNRSTIRFVKF